MENLPAPKKCISGMRKNLWEYGIDFALNTGDNIPAIGLGTWKIPPAELSDTIRNAISFGYRHFNFSNFDDTSEIRGGDVLGEYLHNPLYGRNQFFVTAQLSLLCHHRWKALMNVEELIRDLKCSHFDLLLMQFPLGSGTGSEGTASVEETWKVLETCVKDGKARAIGVSHFNLEQLKRLCSMCEILPAVVQLECHPFNQQKEIIDFCHSKGIHIVCYSPFGSDQGCQELMKNSTLLEIGKKYNKSPNQVIVRWNLQNNRSVIPRTHNTQHLKDNLQVFDFELTKEDLRMIDFLDKGQTFVQPQQPEKTGMRMGQEGTQKSQVGGVGTR
jgi:diketogulonate reductase-like aldo/keto reductase